MRAFNRTVVGLAADQTLVVATEFYKQGVFVESCLDFKKWLRVASSSEADFGRAVCGFADIVSRTLNRWLRHDARRHNKSGVPDEHHPDLTIDSGGWVSKFQVITRLFTLFMHKRSRIAKAFLVAILGGGGGG